MALCEFHSAHVIQQALNDLYKAITALPSDLTLLSLPPGPLLELICIATQRQLTVVWLSLANTLITQLNPPSLVPPLFEPTPTMEAHNIVLAVTSGLGYIQSARLHGSCLLHTREMVMRVFAHRFYYRISI